jgi:hypothetical protein
MTALATVVLVTGLVVVNVRLNGIGRCDTGHFGPQCVRLYGRAGTARDWLVAATVSPIVLGAFFGAPMFSREFERGTYVLPATSDVSPRRWLWAQVLSLLTVATVLATVVCLAAMPVRGSLLISGFTGQWDWPLWCSGWLLVPYAVSSCAIGLAVGALVRKTLPALALTAVVLCALRVGAVDLRGHWWPPVHAYASLEQFPVTPNGAFVVVNDTYADARGNPSSAGNACFDTDGVSSTEQIDQCVRTHGITQRVSTYQPAHRRVPFQSAEGGVFLLLAGASVAGTARLMRRDPPA